MSALSELRYQVVIESAVLASSLYPVSDILTALSRFLRAARLAFHLNAGILQA